MISFLFSLFAGLIASLTPCVAVLFPIALYRFMDKDKLKIKDYIIYVIGFISVFLVFGLLFNGISNSIISSGFRLFLSVALVVLGVLQLMNKINPLNVPIIKNPFLFGGVFAIAIAVNPCTLPYLGTLVGVSVDFGIITNLSLFGIGMLLPSTLLLFVGGSLLTKIGKSGKNMGRFNKIMAIVLIIAGTYLGISILNISKLDILFSSLLLTLFIGYIIYSLWRRNFVKGWKNNLSRISLVSSLILLWVVFTYHCYSTAYGHLTGVCGVNCDICIRCTILFIGAALFGILGLMGIEKYEEKFKRLGS